MLLRKKCYGSTEHTEDTDFLSTEDTFFLVATLEILEEMFFKMLLRKKYCGFTVYLQTKSLTKIFDQNALEFLALWRGFLGIASEMLEISMKILKIIFNQLSVFSVCSVDFQLPTARNLWGKSSLKNGRRPEIICHSASTNKIFNKNP